MVMDILLIDPPYISLKGVGTNIGYNISLTSLAAYLRQYDIEVGILSGDLIPKIEQKSSDIEYSVSKYAEGQDKFCSIVNDNSHPVWFEIAQIIKQKMPLAIGISYLTPSMYSVEKIASLTKQINPDIKIIVGGHHPSFCPDEVLENNHVDYIVFGEGEIPLCKLMQKIIKGNKDLSTVPGIYFKDENGHLQKNPSISLIHDLDSLPFPARDLVLNVDYNKYTSHSTATARGCPYLCTFCADKALWKGKVRRRSIANVLKELQQLKKEYAIEYLDFSDGTFTYDRRYLVSFCNTLIEKKLNLKWRCTARYDNIDKEILELMKNAGCHGLYFGLESGSERMLKSIHKGTTIDSIINKSKMIYDSGISSIASILLGFPDETKEDMESTLQLMKSIRVNFLDINSYMPLPGTPLYESMSKEEKNNIDWKNVGCKSFNNYFVKSISPDDFKRIVFQAYEIANEVQKENSFRW